eukprot:scaffold104942_cov18-Tisochrysis_lutea.AAC.5
MHRDCEHEDVQEDCKRRQLLDRMQLLAREGKEGRLAILEQKNGKRCSSPKSRWAGTLAWRAHDAFHTKLAR